MCFSRQSRREYVSIAGLRIDGRRPGEVRRIQCKLGLLPKVDGSALYEQGNTKVVAVVRGPRQVKSRSQAQHDRAVINCEYRYVRAGSRPDGKIHLINVEVVLLVSDSLAPFATTERKKKRTGDRWVHVGCCYCC